MPIRGHFSVDNPVDKVARGSTLEMFWFKMGKVLEWLYGRGIREIIWEPRTGENHAVVSF